MKRRDFLKMAGVLGAGLAVPGLNPSRAASTRYADRYFNRSALDTVELVQWDWDQLAQSDFLDGEIKLFSEKNPGITVKRVSFDPNKQIKTDTLEIAKKGGTLPDIFMSVYLESYNYPLYSYPLSDFKDFAAFKSTFPDPALDFAEGKNVWKGKAYTAPISERSQWWNQLYVNTKLLEDNGVKDLPTTFDAFLEANRQVVKNSGGKVSGYALPFPQWQAMMWQFVGGTSALIWGHDYRTGKHIFGSEPNYKVVYETLAIMRDEGLILPESATLDDAGLSALFAQDAVAFTSTGIWAVSNWAKSNPDFTHYTLIPPPLVGSAPKFTFINPPGTTGTPWFMGADTPHAAEAWEWYKWLHSKDTVERSVKAGLGFARWPELNKPEYFTSQALKDYAKYSPGLNRIVPAPEIRNPDIAKLQIPPTKPDEPGLAAGIFSGQIKKADIPAVLEKLAADKDAAIQQALSDGAKAGLTAKFSDYVFPDWDPLKDYVQKPGS